MQQDQYNLEKRTTRFGESVIDFCNAINKNTITKPLISQFIRSGTSIGANYMEANAASSKKDFRHKIYICKKEAQETKHWIRMIKKALPKKENNIQNIEKECEELILIFGKIISSLNKINKSVIQN